MDLGITMNIEKLDSEIILYKDNILSNEIELIKKIENANSTENIWQISSDKNINNINITSQSQIFYLDNSSSFFYEKIRLRESLNNFILPIILNYLEQVQESTDYIKPWTIAKTLNNVNFHFDESRNKKRHRHVAIVFLNDDFSGGEIQFKDRIGNEPISFNSGDVLIYPSSNEYLHKVLPVLSGTQYVAITCF